MEEVVEIIACPVCNQEVTLQDDACPHCGAEFAPGIVSGAKTEGKMKNRAANEPIERYYSEKPVVSTGVQTILLGITYIFGYASILAGNYISNGGLLNNSYMMMLVTIGAITIAFAFIAAFLLGRFGGAASYRINIPMMIGFLLLLPPLVFVFRW
jgi:uncharacterized protein YbaR (Trm112 family)